MLSTSYISEEKGKKKKLEWPGEYEESSEQCLKIKRVLSWTKYLTTRVKKRLCKHWEARSSLHAEVPKCVAHVQ